MSREGVRGVAGVAAATPFFEPEKIRNFVISFLSLIDSEKKILLHHFYNPNALPGVVVLFELYVCRVSVATLSPY